VKSKDKSKKVKVKNRELAQLVPSGSCGESVCAACGEPFSCGAALSGCWCVEVELTDEARAHLRERYTGCLCRSCLTSFALKERVEEGKRDGEKEKQVSTGTTH
jgi:hypothetical protein